MSTDHLGAALRGLVDDVEDGLAPPAVDALWVGGRRRRRTARLVPALAAACLAALVALLVWPGGGSRASVPAVGVDDTGALRLTTYPSVIPKPAFPEHTGRPGLTAAAVTELGDTVNAYAVSPAGSVSRLVLPDAGQPSPPSVSPDGRWLARGPVLTDLQRGVTVPSSSVRQGIASARMPTEHPAWWSPDSRRVYVDAIDQGRPTSSGFVVSTDGTVTEAPLLAGGQVPVVAGWLDDDTVLAFVGLDDASQRLGGRTWTVGAASWEVAGLEVEQPADGGDGREPVGEVEAALSPDRSRLLVTTGVTAPGGGEVTGTRAALFDARTGAPVRFRDPAGATSPTTSPESFTWDGFGCHPAWRDGDPVVTDNGVRSTTLMFQDQVVDVSSRYESPCVAFAGDELRGAPVVDSVQVWQERLWVWGGRLLVVLPLAALVWWFARRRSWRPGSEPPVPFTTVRG
jgi:hypothetical protein